MMEDGIMKYLLFYCSILYPKSKGEFQLPSD